MGAQPGRGDGSGPDRPARGVDHHREAADRAFRVGDARDGFHGVEQRRRHRLAGVAHVVAVVERGLAADDDIDAGVPVSRERVPRN
jgi:hypothetical protein